jgi:hypothetical protein
MILPDTYVFTGVESGSALTYEDVPCQDFLTAVTLHAKAFTFGIATVTSTTTSFFMSHFSTPPLRRNTGNFDFSKPLAMASFFTIVLSAIEFNDLDFLVAAVGDHFGSDLRAINNGLADFDVFTSANQEYLVEFDGLAGRGLNFFQLEGFTLNHAVLLTTGFNYCVHLSLRLISLLAF